MNIVHTAHDPSVESRVRNANQAYTQLVFYLTTALYQSGYAAYVIAFYSLLQPVLGEQGALLLLSASVLMEALVESPAGRISDKYGHHVAVVACFAFLCTNAALYIAASYMQHTFMYPLIAVVVLAELALAIGVALESGALNSWFVARMRSLGYDGRLTSFFAMKRLTIHFSWLLAGGLAIAGSGAYGTTFAFYLALLCYASGLVVTKSLLGAPCKTIANDTDTGSVQEAFQEIRDSRRLRAILIGHSVFWTLGVLITYFWAAPLKVRSASTEALALIWSTMALARIVASMISLRLDAASTSDRRVGVFMVGQLLMGLPMCVFPMVEAWRSQTNGILTVVIIGVAYAITRFGQELSKPVVTAWIHEEVSSERNRATIESIIEAMPGLGIATMCFIAVSRPILTSLGVIPEAVDPIQFVYGLLGLVIIVLNVPLMWVTFGSSGRRTGGVPIRS